MGKSFVTAKRSVLLVAVLSVIGTCAQNKTDAKNETTTGGNVATNTVSSSQTITTVTNVSSMTEKGSTTIFDTNTRKSSVTDGRGGTSKNNTADERLTFPTVSIPPLPDDVTLPPAALMIVSGITCGVTIGVFLLCYIATMMNLCFCKFLMHECPSGKFKDGEEKASEKKEKKEEKANKKKEKKEEKANKKKKGKADEEAPPVEAEPTPPPAQTP